MEVALHTVLKEGCEADYDAVHREIPETVARKLRAAGVRDWRIWRDGRHVFHLVDVEDYDAMRTALRDDPDNIGWQQTVGPLFDRPDSYEGGDSGIRQLWTLTDQLQDALRERP
ncbi:L-rhamnose mutarotase [Microlunatus ginsengisoli]|uniref:L-rhamnose mutarotase n=1 Tax=Microlunatus ginsengisoli TaxID=363863 RepID=A0ABP7AJT5_9ACTN